MRRSTKLVLENLASGCFFGVIVGTLLSAGFGPDNVAVGIIGFSFVATISNRVYRWINM